MSAYTIDKIQYGNDTYFLKDSDALHLTNGNNLKIDGILAADKGIFNELIATTAGIENLNVDNLTAQNATVVGLLDVKGELHTKSWTNSNIANIGGSFYISPTVSCEISSSASPMTVTIGGTVNNRIIQISDGNFITDSARIYNPRYVITTDDTPREEKIYYYLDEGEYVVFSGDRFEQEMTYYEFIETESVVWRVGSHVMITGNIRFKKNEIDGIDYPLGTCSGYLTAPLSSDGFTIGNVNSSALETIINTLGISDLKSYNISISMFEVGPEESLKPIGIMMTSYGVNNSTYIDVYGGVNVKNLSNLNVDPNVRIGYLGDIEEYTDSVGNIHNPTGWGIYTDNGYFKGVITADSGLIGGFTIGNNELYSQNKTDVKSTTTGAYVGPLGFNVSGGTSESTTFFTKDEVSIGGVLNWVAASGSDSSNLSIKADEIIIGADYVITEDIIPQENKRYYHNTYVEFTGNTFEPNVNYYELIEQDYIITEDITPQENKTYYYYSEYVEFTGNTFEPNVDYYELIDFKVKSLLQDAIDTNQQQTEEINNLINITNILEVYDKFITTIDNNNNSYIDLQYKDSNYKPKIRIASNNINFSLDNDENIITKIENNLMHTTFGEFENLRMRANNVGKLTWIARDNGHLSLKVVE